MLGRFVLSIIRILRSFIGERLLLLADSRMPAHRIAPSDTLHFSPFVHNRFGLRPHEVAVSMVFAPVRVEEREGELDGPWSPHWLFFGVPIILKGNPTP